MRSAKEFNSNHTGTANISYPKSADVPGMESSVEAVLNDEPFWGSKVDSPSRDPEQHSGINVGYG